MARARCALSKCGSRLMAEVWTLASCSISSPHETWILVTYRSASRQNAMTSASSMPPGIHSSAEMRISMGKRGPTASRHARNTCNGNRIRFSIEPPYASVRWLNRGLKNWSISQPCPKCKNTMSKPARRASTHACAQQAAVRPIMSGVIARTSTPSSRTKASGPMA